MTYSAEVLADTPLGYWRLGDASGTSVTDSSGNSKTGTLTGTVGRVTGLLVGDANGCFDFDGSTTWVDTPVTGTGQPAISAEALISLDGNNKVQNIHGRADEASGGSFVQFILRVSAANKAEFSARKGGAWVTATGTTTLAIGTTYHVAGTADGSSVNIYVNGVLETTVSNASAMVSVSTLGGLIGAGWNGAQYAKFDGKIDEVAFYASVLSSTRIAAHYAAATNPGAASGTGSLSLSGSGAAKGAATGSGSLSLSGSGAAKAAATGSGSLSLSASGDTVAPSPATGTGSLSLSGSGSAGVGRTGTASLSLVGTGSAVGSTAATGTASLSFSASGSATLADSGTGFLSLAATGVAEALYVTDTSNLLNGRVRRARATSTVTRPVGTAPSNLATKYDKAVPLPPPTLVDGRVT